jgi:hypothetical protein
MKLRTWVGFLVGFDTLNIWRIWHPRKQAIYHEQDVEFNEEVFYDQNDPFPGPRTLETQLEPLSEIIKTLDFSDIEARSDISDEETQSNSN